MIAKYLDSTNLKPEATNEDIRKLCEDAANYQMGAVCVQPYRLKSARVFLKGSKVKLCTVIGFPLGADTGATKLEAAGQALKDGAHELDMVINIGAFKDRNYDYVKNEILSLLKLKSEYDFILKVIVETALLDTDELRIATRLVSETGADFIKTSTGFARRGVNLEDIAVIKAYKDSSLMIKASGGIKTLDFARKLLEAGVDRIGTSSAVNILEEIK